MIIIIGSFLILFILVLLCSKLYNCFKNKNTLDTQTKTCTQSAIINSHVKIKEKLNNINASPNYVVESNFDLMKTNKMETTDDIITNNLAMTKTSFAYNEPNIHNEKEMDLNMHNENQIDIEYEKNKMGIYGLGFKQNIEEDKEADNNQNYMVGIAPIADQYDGMPELKQEAYEDNGEHKIVVFKEEFSDNAGITPL